MADNTLSTRRDRLADIFRVFDKMWNLLDRVRENEEIQMHTDVDIANEDRCGFRRGAAGPILAPRSTEPIRYRFGVTSTKRLLSRKIAVDNVLLSVESVAEQSSAYWLPSVPTNTRRTTSSGAAAPK